MFFIYLVRSIRFFLLVSSIRFFISYPLNTLFPVVPAEYVFSYRNQSADFFLSFCLEPVVPFSRFDGGILLGPLPIVTSIPLVSVPNPHLGASSLVFSYAYTLVFSCAYPLVLPFSH